MLDFEWRVVKSLKISDSFSVGEMVKFCYYNNKGILSEAKGTILEFKKDYMQREYALIKEAETGRIYSIDQYTTDAIEESYLSITRIY